MSVTLTFFLLCCLILTVCGQCPNKIGNFSYPSLHKLTDSGPTVSKGDWVMTGNDGLTYNWNICAPQNYCPSCDIVSTVACQSCNNPPNPPKSLGVLSQQLIQTLPGINSVNFIYLGGTFSNSCNQNRNSNISVACVKGAPTTALGVFATPGSCDYSILMSSGDACPSQPL